MRHIFLPLCPITRDAFLRFVWWANKRELIYTIHVYFMCGCEKGEKKSLSILIYYRIVRTQQSHKNIMVHLPRVKKTLFRCKFHFHNSVRYHEWLSFECDSLYVLFFFFLFISLRSNKNCHGKNELLTIRGISRSKRKIGWRRDWCLHTRNAEKTLLPSLPYHDENVI